MLFVLVGDVSLESDLNLAALIFAAWCLSTDPLFLYAVLGLGGSDLIGGSLFVW
jgi:hypothetical protein